MNTVDTIVAKVLNDRSEMEKFSERAVNLRERVADGLRDLNMFHYDGVEEGFFDIQPDNSILFPPGYLSWIVVGVPNGTSYIPLGHNTNIINYEKYCCGTDTRQNAETTKGINPQGWYYINYDSVRSGQYVGAQYGATGGQHRAYFKEVKNKRKILLSGPLGCQQIYMRWITNGINVSGETIIPEELVDPLRYYVHWQISLFDNKMSANKSLYWEKLYDDAVRKLRAFVMRLTIEDARDIIYSTSMQAPKR